MHARTITIWRRIAWLALASGWLGLAACNTVAGFGQDVSDAGHALKKAAD
jgi:entericidin A